MLIPAPNTTCYWNDRGEVRNAKRIDGMCPSGRDNYVMILVTDDDYPRADKFEVCVEDLYGKEIEAIRAAEGWCYLQIVKLIERRKSL